MKKIKTERDVPFPLPKKEPKYMHKKINEDDIILKCIPNTDPIIKNIIINNKLPKPIPKCEPTYPIYIEVYMIDIFVDVLLSKNLDLIR